MIFADPISQRRTALVVHGSLTPVACKAIRILMLALTLILTASNSQAGLGWTLAQFKQQYGKPLLDEQIAGRMGYVFTEEDYIIAAFFRNAQVSRILYICRGGSVLDGERAMALLKTNAPDAVWDAGSKNEADDSYRVNGTKDGSESYYASLTEDGKMLAIWTKEDDEVGRTTARLDTPASSTVASSKAKLTGEVTAVDDQPTPEISHPDGPARATLSPKRKSASVQATRTKITTDKLRSSGSRREVFHVANLDARARPIAFPRQPGGGQAPAPTPLLMNAGTGLYNSDYTQPFKNSKKAAP